jgi:predicted DNA-binding transcriptional regulator AlpA
MQTTIQPYGGHGLRQTAAPHTAPAGPALTVPDVSARSGSFAASKILLSDAEGAAVYGVSVRTFMDLQHEPWFPKPVRLGPRLKRHLRAELEAAVVNIPRQDRPAEPVQLLRGKVEKKARARGAA